MPNYIYPQNYGSPALYIDFARLPAPDVIEVIAYEELLKIYKAEVLAKNPRLESALKLEQSPTNLILEVQSYGEMLVRARVNAAARAVMLPFSTGNDLENLAAFYGVTRLEGESDASLRRRVQLAPEAFSTAGSQGGYIFQALSADATIRDASAIRVNDLGGVKVTVMNAGSDPMPTVAQLTNVRNRLLQPNIKPLTDVVTVSAPTVKQTKIEASIALYPGPDGAVVLNNIGTAMAKVRDRISILGRDLTRSAIISACYQEGVENVTLASPAQDIIANDDECVQITSASIGIEPIRVS